MADLGTVLAVLATDAQATSECPLAIFARDLQSQPHSGSALEAATAQQRSYESDLQSIDQSAERCRLAEDRLRSELSRIEAQMGDLARRRRVAEDGVRLCRAAVSALASGGGSLTGLGGLGGSFIMTPAQLDSGAGSAPVPSAAQSAPHPSAHHSSSPVPTASMERSDKDRFEAGGRSAAPAAAPGTNAAASYSGGSADTATAAAPHEPRRGSLAGDASPVGILTTAVELMQIQGAEGALAQALSRADELAVASAAEPYGSGQEADLWAKLVSMAITDLSSHRPPLQIQMLHICAQAVRRAEAVELPPPSPSGRPVDVSQAAITADAVGVAARMLKSVNDDVKVEALDLIAALLSYGEVKEAMVSKSMDVLVNIVATSSTEPVLERALIVLWNACTLDEAKLEALRCGAVRAVIDLLFTDSMAILDNVTMTLAYLTRDESVKAEMRECGGLEKLVASLYHPSEMIQGRVAGAIWNCGAVPENRTKLRSLGAIPALSELLDSSSEAVRESATGALWNMVIDAESKTQFGTYGGLGRLLQLLNSDNEGLVENASGTLWNCSATVENRAALRRLGAAPVVLTLLQHQNTRVQENAAGALRNLVINDQTKSAIREANGFDIIMKTLVNAPSAVVDKLVSTLWILTVTPENKHALRNCGGFPQLIHMMNTIDNYSLKEKILGSIRNCSMASENRGALVRDGAIAALVKIGREPNPQSGKLTYPVRENLCSSLWQLGREDQDRVRTDGAMKLMIDFLADAQFGVVEQAAGALGAMLSNNQANKSHLREHGGMTELMRLASGERRAPVSGGRTVVTDGVDTAMRAEGKPCVLMNVYHTLKYATAQHEENQRFVLSWPDSITRAFALLKNPPTLPENAPGARPPEDVLREILYFLKNVAGSPGGPEAIVAARGHETLVQLEQHKVENVRRGAASVLQLVGAK